MAECPIQNYNNTVQKVYRGRAKAVIFRWRTNDVTAPWGAEARVVCLHGGEPKTAGRASAKTEKEAKALAATEGYEWLKATYPDMDL